MLGIYHCFPAFVPGVHTHPVLLSGTCVWAEQPSLISEKAGREKAGREKSGVSMWSTWVGVSVHAGCDNITPQAGWFANNRILFLTVLEAKKSNIKAAGYREGPLSGLSLS